MPRRKRLGAPGARQQAFGQFPGIDFDDFFFGDDGRGRVAPGDPGGLCRLLIGPARRACEVAAGIIFGDDDGSVPGDPIVDPGRGPCPPFMSPSPITGECVLDFDPGPGVGLPGGNGATGAGLTRPSSVSRQVLECPRFADGKTGILWMNALTGDVVCLPRRTSGRGFGLIRKNKPRKKAFISAAQKKSLDDIAKVQAKAKKFATDAGFSCKKR